MNTMVSIKETRNSNINPKIYDFLSPDYVYIPIKEGFKLNIKEGDNVLKESVILKDSFNNKIYSPISGIFNGVVRDMRINNKLIDCICIENDYMEKLNKRRSTIKYISEYSKEDVFKLISKYTVCKYKLDIDYKTIIINGIDKDPFEKTNSYIIDTNIDKILETIDALSNILEVKDTIFCINNNDTNNVINLTNNIGTYPNIKLKLVPDIYPIGYKDILISNILTKKQLNSNYLYLTVGDVLNIYNILKRKKPICEKLITISGNAIKNPVVANVKIGTTLNDVLKECVTIDNIKYKVIVNGLLNGITINTANNIITEDIRSIFLNTIDTSKENKCINCGLCTMKCPVGLNPKYIREHKKADRSKCIHCGLCSYICPAKINFKPYLGGNEDE